MSSVPTVVDVLDAIYAADARELELAEEAIKERKAQLGMEDELTMRNVHVGDTLYFNGNTSNYLLNLPVEVVGKARTRVKVKCPDEHAYRRFQGQVVRAPLSILKRNPN
jgi:hypothetical protein